MNLYGYAGGDPVNNSDPFGLSVVARGLLANQAIGLLYESSSTFRRTYRSLLFDARVEVVVRVAASQGDLAFLRRASETPIAGWRELSSNSGEILYHPILSDAADLANYLPHEFAHAAGAFSFVTGADPICGLPDRVSISCVRRFEDAVKSERDAHARRKARQESEKNEDQQKDK